MSIESFDDWGATDKTNSQVETVRLTLRAMGYDFASTEARINEALRHREIVTQFKELTSLIKDPLHNHYHHEAVVNNCIYIFNNQPIGVVNSDVVEIAGWSHDIERPNLKTNNRIDRNILELKGKKSEVIDAVLETINRHSFGQKQSSVEAKVLYDADKVEYVSFSRMLNFDKALLSGKETEERFVRFKKEWEKLIPRVRNTMHFEVSKELFDLRFREAATNLKGHSKLSFVHGIWYNLYQPNG